MSKENVPIIWAEDQFTGKTTRKSQPAQQRKISLWGITKALVLMRHLLNNDDTEEARKLADSINSLKPNPRLSIFLAAFHEMQVAVEIEEGRYEHAIELLEKRVIPVYKNFPKALEERAQGSLDTLLAYARKAA